MEEGNAMSPAYEYKCNKCKIVLSRFRPVKDRDLFPDCPNCEISCKRIISVPGEPRGGDTPKFHRR